MDPVIKFAAILVLVFGVILLIITSISILIMFLMDRVRILNERGDTKGAYRLVQKALQVARLIHLRKSPVEWFVPVLTLQAGQLAEALGDTEAALGWAKQISDGNFATDYRAMALQNQANWLRKLNRDAEAKVLEAEALTLPAEIVLDKDTSNTPESSMSKYERIVALQTQGSFAEALARIETAWLYSDDRQKMGLAHQKAVILRILGRYEEALAAQRDVDTRFEALLPQKNSSNGVSNSAVRSMLRNLLLVTRTEGRLTRIQICLESGKIGSAGEIWDTLPAEVAHDNTEALRYATGAWLFAVRGNTDAARRLINETPVNKDKDKQGTIHSLLGRALLALHDYDAASKQFQMGITCYAGKPLAEAETRTLMATCYTKQEKFDLARAEWEAAVATGFEEAFFTQEARTQLARLQTNDTSDTQPMRLAIGNR